MYNSQTQRLLKVVFGKYSVAIQTTTNGSSDSKHEHKLLGYKGAKYHNKDKNLLNHGKKRLKQDDTCNTVTASNLTAVNVHMLHWYEQ